MQTVSISTVQHRLDGVLTVNFVATIKFLSEGDHYRVSTNKFIDTALILTSPSKFFTCRTRLWRLLWATRQRLSSYHAPYATRKGPTDFTPQNLSAKLYIVLLTFEVCVGPWSASEPLLRFLPTPKSKRLRACHEHVQRTTCVSFIALKAGPTKWA